jgi:hypothetical protein
MSLQGTHLRPSMPGWLPPIQFDTVEFCLVCSPVPWMLYLICSEQWTGQYWPVQVVFCIL